MKKTLSLVFAILMMLSTTFVLTGCQFFEKKEPEFKLEGVNLDDVTGATKKEDVIKAIGVTVSEQKLVTTRTENGIESYTIRNFDSSKKETDKSYTIRFFPDKASYDNFVSSNVESKNGKIVKKNSVILFTVNHERLGKGTSWGTYESLNNDKDKIVR